MTIKEANNKLEQINNDIEFWLNEKELELCDALPKSTDPSKEKVIGGERADKFYNFVVGIQPIDKILDLLYAKKKNYEDYIEKELHRLNKYREVEQLIIYYKEQCLEEYTWEQIGKKVYMNKDNCRKIYRKWKGERNIGN